MIIYQNGSFLPLADATLAPNDRGFLLADGLFETIKIVDRTMLAFADHWQRFSAGAEFLEIPLPLSAAEIHAIIQQLLVLNAYHDAAARITLTRGTGPRGLDYPEPTHPTIVITVFPLSGAIVNQTVAITISSIRRNEFSPLAQIKSLAYLDNSLARREAKKNGFQEAILLNTKGFVAEACAANVFLFDAHGTLLTPPLHDGALPGVTRKRILAIAAKEHIPFEVRSIHPDELYQAREIFLTNALIGIQSVAQLNQHPLETQLSNSLKTLYQQQEKNMVCP